MTIDQDTRPTEQQWTLDPSLEADDALTAAFEEMASRAPAAKRPASKPKRQAAAIKAIKEFDVDVLLSANDKLSEIINKLAANAWREPHQWTDEYLEQLMTEILDEREMIELLTARNTVIREMMFDLITLRNQQAGVKDPEWAGGKVEVPAKGMVFERRGGRQTWEIDLDKLKDRLGSERWNEVHTVEVVPEQRKVKLNKNALLTLMHKDPAVVEIVGECGVPGKRTNQSFHLEPFTAQESDGP